jgi:hypothetical protein
MIQLFIEYDPHPPFDSGHLSKASEPVRSAAKALLRKTALNPAEVRAYPAIAWQRALHTFRKRRKPS